jgi:hypothetical protein
MKRSWTSAGERIAANDPALRRFIEADGEGARGEELERLIVGAMPLLRRVVASFEIGAADVEDVAATAALRVVKKLREVAVSDDHAIASFDDYIETVAYNAVQEIVRRRFPARNRLRNRLRYLLTHDPRFASWRSERGELVAGLARWKGQAARDYEIARTPPEARDAARSAEALLALLRHAGAPLRFDLLVDLTAELWGVSETSPVEPKPEPAGALERFLTRDSLAALWGEIRQLREPQRAALLLNLRDVDGANAAGLLIVAGIATFDELAAAAGLSPERLAAIWNDLPLDDLSIASALGLTRQQVINLRKCARERLRRRLGVTS